MRAPHVTLTACQTRTTEKSNTETVRLQRDGDAYLQPSTPARRVMPQQNDLHSPVQPSPAVRKCAYYRQIYSTSQKIRPAPVTFPSSGNKSQTPGSNVRLDVTLDIQTANSLSPVSKISGAGAAFFSRKHCAMWCRLHFISLMRVIGGYTKRHQPRHQALWGRLFDGVSGASAPTPSAPSLHDAYLFLHIALDFFEAILCALFLLSPQPFDFPRPLLGPIHGFLRL